MDGTAELFLLRPDGFLRFGASHRSKAGPIRIRPSRPSTMTMHRSVRRARNASTAVEIPYGTASMTPTTWQEWFNPLLVTYRPAGSARRSITYTKLCNCAALTSFFRANVWRGQAEHLADSLSKGDRVMVTGRLRQLGHRAGGR